MKKQPKTSTKRALALTHLDAEGRAQMVDVSAKPATARVAVAEARVRMKPATLRGLRSGDTRKGDVLAVARIAGIQAAKRTSELIPLCHAIHLTKVTMDLRLEAGMVVITATAHALDRTGVEMEALVAASTAALTVYDMLKAVDRGMSFDVRLLSKDGGKTGAWRAE